MRTTLRFSFVASVLFCGSYAFGQSVCDAKPTPTVDEALSEIARLNRLDCLGGRDCPDPVCKEPNDWFRLPAGPGRKTATQIIGAIRDSAAALPDSPERTKLLHKADPLAAFDPAESRVVVANSAQFFLDQGVLFADDVDEIDPEKVLTTECSSAAACTATFNRLREIITRAALIGRVIVEKGEPGRKELLDYIRLVDDQWRAYITTARAQYPWELLANSARYPKTRYFVGPPANQLILAHPSAGFEISDKAGGKMAESLILETIGFYRWKWEGTDTKQRLGGSIILAWRSKSTEESKRWGYGFLLYLPKQGSVGYVFRNEPGGGKHSAVIGADVGKFIFGADKLRQRLFAKRQ